MMPQPRLVLVLIVLMDCAAAAAAAAGQTNHGNPAAAAGPRTRTITLTLPRTTAVATAAATATGTGTTTAAATAVCTTVKDEAIVSDQRGSAGAGQIQIQLTCPATSEELRCTGPGLEPLDMPVAEICRSQASTLPLHAAREVAITSPQPVQLEIEWLTLSPSGQQRVARRTQVVNQRISLPVADVDHRFVRFLRRGASPVTVSAKALLAQPVWPLPDPQGGGEFIGLIEPAAILPIAYQLSALRAWDIARRDGDPVVSVQAVPAGSYDVIPVYQGGLRGAKAPVVVADGASTVIALKPEDVGAASITAPAAMCATASEFGIRQISRSTTFGTLSSDIFHAADLTTCRWTVAGLHPGTYDAWLRNSGGSAGSQGFEVAPQQHVTIALVAPTVTVSGHVTYVKAPAENLKVDFIRKSDGSSGAATTDAQGAYELTLDRPGEYMVGLVSGSLQEMRQASLTVGANTADFTIKRGGSLQVHVENQTGDATTTVELRGTGASAYFSQNAIPAGNTDVTWSSLPFDTFEVWAHQGHLASEAKRVALSPGVAEASVVLELTDNRSTLTLRDETGRPVDNARFRLLIPPPEQVSPGVYALDTIAPGSILRIRTSAGLVPVCRLAPRDQSIEITLTSGRPVTLQFPDRVDTLDAAGSLVLDGSDCPVPLVDFASTRLGGPAKENEPSRFLIQNFPSTATRIAMVGPRGRQTLAISDAGLVTVQP